MRASTQSEPRDLPPVRLAFLGVIPATRTDAVGRYVLHLPPTGTYILTGVALGGEVAACAKVVLRARSEHVDISMPGS